MNFVRVTDKHLEEVLDKLRKLGTKTEKIFTNHEKIEISSTGKDEGHQSDKDIPHGILIDGAWFPLIEESE
jgi:hypothetical protein